MSPPCEWLKCNRRVTAAQVYCGGTKLESFHLLRVHGVMSAGRPLVVLGPQEEYDRPRGAEIAEKAESGGGGCCSVM